MQAMCATPGHTICTDRERSYVVNNSGQPDLLEVQHENVNLQSGTSQSVGDILAAGMMPDAVHCYGHLPVVSLQKLEVASAKFWPTWAIAFPEINKRNGITEVPTISNWLAVVPVGSLTYQ